MKPYVDELVNKKIKEKQRVNNSLYVETIDKLKVVGINWITLDSLKSKVKRAYAAAIKKSSTPPIANTDSRCVNTTPPPPGVLPSDTSRSIPTVCCKGGRPKGSTNDKQSLIDKCCTEARTEITELYYAEYLQIKSTETDRISLCKAQERVTKGTFQQIHDSVKLHCNLPSNFTLLLL